MPPLKKLKDWKGWWDGLRSKAMRAGGESISANVGALLATNGIASMAPSLGDIALSWKAFLATTLIQFALRVTLAAAEYVKTKPDPDPIDENVTGS